MLTNRVIPSLLIKDKGLVKTVKFNNPKYVGDPINAVKIFNDKEVDELVILDITATAERRKPDFEYIADIASEAFMPFGYGGGIRAVEDVKRLLSMGVEKVIINSKAVEDPDFVKEVADVIGSQSVVVSIDVKKSLLGKYIIYSNGGKKKSNLDLIDYIKKVQSLGAGELFINSIDRDGTLNGFDIELIRTITEQMSIPVIACGGAGRLEDLKEAINKGGASAVAAGSIFVFHGKHRAVLIDYPAVEKLENILDNE